MYCIERYDKFYVGKEKVSLLLIFDIYICFIYIVVKVILIFLYYVNNYVL